jgi:hypothetical protein
VSFSSLAACLESLFFTDIISTLHFRQSFTSRCEYKKRGNNYILTIIQLLSIPLSLDDLKGVDEDLHKNLSWILDNDVVENGLDDQPFTVDWDVLGEQKTANLCPNGDQITLTELNKVFATWSRQPVYEINRPTDRLLFLSSEARQVSLDSLFQSRFSERKVEPG